MVHLLSFTRFYTSPVEIDAVCTKLRFAANEYLFDLPGILALKLA
jgi:hypothetical protein